VTARRLNNAPPMGRERPLRPKGEREKNLYCTFNMYPHSQEHSHCSQVSLQPKTHREQ
jgi:hypothetical protein